MRIPCPQNVSHCANCVLTPAPRLRPCGVAPQVIARPMAWKGDVKPSEVPVPKEVLVWRSLYQNWRYLLLQLSGLIYLGYLITAVGTVGAYFLSVFWIYVGACASVESGASPFQPLHCSCLGLPLPCTHGQCLRPHINNHPPTHQQPSRIWLA